MDIVDINSDFDSFLIGRANDINRDGGTTVSTTQPTTFFIDEFQFWPRKISHQEVLVIGWRWRPNHWPPQTSPPTTDLPPSPQLLTSPTTSLHPSSPTTDRHPSTPPLRLLTATPPPNYWPPPLHPTTDLPKPTPPPPPPDYWPPPQLLTSPNHPRLLTTPPPPTTDLPNHFPPPLLSDYWPPAQLLTSPNHPPPDYLPPPPPRLLTSPNHPPPNYWPPLQLLTSPTTSLHPSPQLLTSSPTTDLPQPLYPAPLPRLLTSPTTPPTTDLPKHSPPPRLLTSPTTSLHPSTPPPPTTDLPQPLYPAPPPPTTDLPHPLPPTLWLLIRSENPTLYPIAPTSPLYSTSSFAVRSSAISPHPGSYPPCLRSTSYALSMALVTLLRHPLAPSPTTDLPKHFTLLRHPLAPSRLTPSALISPCLHLRHYRLPQDVSTSFPSAWTDSIVWRTANSWDTRPLLRASTAELYASTVSITP